MENLTSDVGLSLVDVNLGDGETDGIELIARMRRSGYRCFACVLTGYSDTDTLFRALDAGADDYLIKPFSGADIEYILARASGAVASGAGLSEEIHGRYLAARGAHEDEIPTLCEFHNRGYPDDKILADALGEKAVTITKRMQRVRERLGLDNRYQLVHLLTVLSGYGARYRTARRKEG